MKFIGGLYSQNNISNATLFFKLLHDFPQPDLNYNYKRDETWAEFSSLELAAWMTCISIAMKQNGLA